MKPNKSLLTLALSLALAAPLAGHAAATITIVNVNAAGVGFNDPTPVAPVGGNPGTTLGQQRLNAFQAAANIWGATLTSNVTINIQASMEPLTCTATSAVLGSAGPMSVFRDFGGAPMAAHWYHVALANKLTGTDLDPSGDDIRARFNSNLGQANCLPGSPFYLGLDGNHGSAIDLVTVLLHEFGHGLGFSNVTNGSNGSQLSGFPSMWDPFIFDNSLQKNWDEMTASERAASGINPLKVVWTGSQVSADMPNVLNPGVPRLAIQTPSGIAGDYLVGTASFGPALTSPGVSGTLMPVTSTAGGGNACSALSGADALAVNHRIALIDRGGCTFTIKVKNAQNAGALGVVIADNAAGSPPAGLGGSDPTITIPSVRVTLDDGALLHNALKTRSRTGSSVSLNLGINPNQYAGADAAGRVYLYTPNPYQSGSSVSHWDTGAFPNLLMEPAINGDLSHSVVPPQDLTNSLLKDVGW